MRKDVIGMEPPVSNEYRNCSTAGDMPVDQFISCSKLIPFTYGLYDCIGINLIEQIIQRNEVHLVKAFLRAAAGFIIAFGVLWISCKGKA